MELLREQDRSQWGQAFSLPPGFCPARARPREILWQRNQPRRNRIVFDVTLDSLKLFFIANQVIVAFVLPKGSVVPAQNPIRFVTGVAFERTKLRGCVHMRRDEQMHVIRHDYEGVQIIAAETMLAIVDRPEHQFSDFGVSQEYRSTPRTIQQPVHGNKRLAGREAIRRKNPVVRQASMQAEGYKERLPDNVPMWQTALISVHACMVQENTFFSRSFCHPRRAGQKPGCSPKGLPHNKVRPDSTAKKCCK
jgi:hypothetical protein